MTADYISFEDVLDELAIEGAAPDYATLLQWQKRYPKYRETLAAHFALWAIQSEPIDPLPEIDEEAIVRQGVEYAMGLLRKQGRLIEDDKVEKLGAFDQLVLTAITLLQGEGNSVSITKRLSEFLGREALLGSTLMSLNRLEKRGLTESRWSAAETEPDGASRQYFTVTLTGERALAHAKATEAAVSDYLADFA